MIEVQDSQVVSEKHNVSHSQLVQAAKQAPDRQWIEEYLDLVKDLLEFTGVEESDPRLAVSLSKGFGIVVNVNRRHVLTSFKNNNPWAGFIFDSNFEQLSEMILKAIGAWQFKSHAGESPGKTPYILRFKGSPKDLLTSEQQQVWKATVLAELKRGKSSPYKRWHNPTVYKAVVDPEYRALVLKEAFSDSSIESSIIPEFDSKSELNTERQRVEVEGYFNAEKLEDARQRVTASIVQRQGQPEFRQRLLNAYGRQCPITGCDAEPAIEAAHIVPYQGSETNHPTNGLPLRADIHTLFDLHLLSIRPNTYEIVIAPELVGTCYQKFAGQKITFPQNQVTLPSQDALSKHYEIFLQKRKNSQETAATTQG